MAVPDPSTLTPFATGAGVTVVGGGTGGLAGTNALQNVNTDQGALGDLTSTYPWQKPPLRAEVYSIEAKAAPFMRFLNGPAMKVETSWGQRYCWKEQGPMPELDTIAGSTLAIGTTVFVVSNPNLWTTHHVGVCLTPACSFWVQSVNYTTGALTVVWINAPAVPLTNAASIINISSAYRNIDTPTPQPWVEDVQLDNWYQRPRDFMVVSDVALRGKYNLPLNGDPWNWYLNRMKELHDEKREKTFLFGMRGLSLTGNNPAGFMDGAYFLAATNFYTLAGAALAKATFDDYISVMRINRPSLTGEIVHFVGTNQRRSISGFANAANVNQNLSPGDNELGVTVDTYYHPEGYKVGIVRHPLFDKLGLFGLGLTVILDPEAIYRVTHEVCPETRRVDAIIPLATTMVMAGFESMETLCVCDEAGHLGVLADAGAP